VADPRPGAGGYADADRERRLAEPPKTGRRGPFARDRARIVHSSALRRLAAKTQVVAPLTDDFVRNRLTHSLEVAQIGRDLGMALGCDGDVVEAACLAHDLGHPPFGHNGEAALDAVAAGIGGFEGNAQTLRVLTRLEPKVVDGSTGAPGGLNLTRATLDACTKYPWRRGKGPVPAKFGVYADDADVFTWLRDGAPGDRRCLEAQVMDLADDVAYSVHDVEDAVVGGHLEPSRLAVPAEVARVVAQTCSWYLPQVEPPEVAAALARLRAMPAWVDRFDGSHRALAALKDMTSDLIGRFSAAAERATRERYGPGPLRRYDADVVVPRVTLVEIGTLKGVAAVYVMTAEARQPLYAEQRDMLTELTIELARRAPEGLEPPFAAAWDAADDDGARLRVVVDQVASLTDTSAVLRRDRLCRGR
jgi:dGTPase